mmetsp:Transcript_58126/g.114349  ORF Transcript_58126/g.114349 Transcript_58126/m.114349 type:complete len:136 (+) Transcript_58126:447-854(+)
MPRSLLPPLRPLPTPENDDDGGDDFCQRCQGCRFSALDFDDAAPLSALAELAAAAAAAASATLAARPPNLEALNMDGQHRIEIHSMGQKRDAHLVIGHFQFSARVAFHAECDMDRVAETLGACLSCLELDNSDIW